MVTAFGQVYNFSYQILEARSKLHANFHGFQDPLSSKMNRILVKFESILGKS